MTTTIAQPFDEAVGRALLPVMCGESLTGKSARPTGCPLCDTEPVRLFEKDGIPIWECPGCTHRFALPPEPETHVAEVYGDAYFHGGGAGYSDYLSESALLREHGRRYARLLSRHVKQPGTLLDVGAAAGFLLQGFRDAGWDGEGVEPNAAMARHAREQLGVPVTASSLEEFSPAAPAVSNASGYDVVSLIQVMAHFVDPNAAIERVAELVRPGGMCLVETWNVRSWTARLFGRQWHEYSPPSVLHWYSPTTLRRVFEPAGFHQIAQGRPGKWLNLGHAKSLLRHKLPSGVCRMGLDLTLGLLPDRWQVPYPSEDLFWALFQKD